MKTRVKKISVILLCIFFVLSLIGNVKLYNTNSKAIEKYSKIEEQYSICSNDKKDLDSLYTSLSDSYQIIENEKNEIQTNINNLQQELEEKEKEIYSLQQEISTLKKK